MPRTLLITGATGTVSTALMNALHGTDVRIRALVRDRSRVDAIQNRGVEVFVGDLDDPRSLPPAFTGVRDLWLLTPNGPRAPENNMNALWAARETGVRRVVRLSAIGAAHDAPNRSGRLHALSDHETERSGMRWTILRPHWFMQNLLNEATDIATTDTFALNMANARIGMIDVRDIADCAARVLLDDSDHHHGRTYTLTGPRSLTFADVATELSRALGRPITYRPATDAAKRETLLGYGVPPWIVDMLEEYAQAYAHGWGEVTTDTVTTLLGRSPRAVADFVRDHAAAFGPPKKTPERPARPEKRARFRGLTPDENDRPQWTYSQAVDPCRPVPAQPPESTPPPC